MTERVVCATTDYTLRDQEQMKAAQRYFAWQARIVRRELGQRVIEVGCGVGNFTRHLLDRELVAALDVEADCVAQLVRNLGGPANVIARQLDVVDPAFVELRKHAPDSIVCLNVLEHIRDDIGRFAIWRRCCLPAARPSCWCRRLKRSMDRSTATWDIFVGIRRRACGRWPRLPASRCRRCAI